jgi:dihydroorotase
MLPAAALRLTHSGEIGLLPLPKALTANPAKLLGLPWPPPEKGAPADLVLVDLDQPWVVDKAQIRARSKNSPFDESKMQGRVLLTMVAGKPVYQYAGGERG